MKTSVYLYDYVYCLIYTDIIHTNATKEKKEDIFLFWIPAQDLNITVLLL